MCLSLYEEGSTPERPVMSQQSTRTALRLLAASSSVDLPISSSIQSTGLLNTRSPAKSGCFGWFTGPLPASSAWRFGVGLLCCRLVYCFAVLLRSTRRSNKLRSHQAIEPKYQDLPEGQSQNSMTSDHQAIRGRAKHKQVTATHRPQA